MKWIAATLLGFLAIGGIVKLIVYFVGRKDLLIKPDRTLGHKSFLALGFIHIGSAIIGLLLLFSDGFPPLDILLGLSIFTLLCEVTFRRGSILGSG
jgi:hypothetical protein